MKQALAYILLSSVYLLYWPHVEYFVDDWLLTKVFREAERGGASGAADLVVRAAQNNIYGVFRSQWVGIVWGFLVTTAGRYSAAVNFAALLALHAACAWLLSQALWRLGMGRGLGFLAGALYVLAPSAHFGLVTYLTNPFFVLGIFWVLLMLWCFARGAPAGAAACAVAGLFSGEQAFLLLWGALPLAALCFGPRPRYRASIAAVWAALAIAGGVYLLGINRAPVVATGLESRYAWSGSLLRTNLKQIWREMQQLSGAGHDALFRIAPERIDLLLAAAAAVLVAALVWRWSEELPQPVRLWRAGLFALAGVALAYGPVLFVTGSFSRFRYHYAPSPFLGLALATACWLFVRPGRPPLVPALLGGVLAGFFTLSAAADLRQCWIPQSREHRALEARLLSLENLAPGDILIVSSIPYEIGTAQHFTMHSSVTAQPFAERVTGVAPLEVSFELVDLKGELWLDRREGEMRGPLSLGDLRRVHLLAWHGGSFLQLRWAAREVEHGKFRLLPLKGVEAPAGIEDAVFSREQLSLQSGRIYIAKHAH